MSDIKVEFNSEGFRQILIGNGVKSIVESTTQKIANRANSNLTDPEAGGYESIVEVSSDFSTYNNGERWAGFVRSTDKATRRDEAENKSLSRAVN